MAEDKTNVAGSSSPGFGESERAYTLSKSEENRKKSFEEEDKRWTWQHQLIDWSVLIGGIIVWLAFQLIFYFLVPGIK